MLNAWALGAGSGDSTSSKFSKRFKNFSRSQIAESYWIESRVLDLFPTPTIVGPLHDDMSIQAAKGRIPCASIT